MKARTNLLLLAVLGSLALYGQAFAQWSEPVPVIEVNTDSAEEWAPFLSFDGLTLYFARVRSNTFYYGRIFEATREQPFGPFTSVKEISGPLNSSHGHVLCPWVSPDNLRMYYHNERGGRFMLKVSERTSVIDPWPEGTSIAELNELGDQLLGPKLIPDELTIFFTAYEIPGGQGGYDVWMATRPDRNSPFGQVRNLQEINTTSYELAPFVSPDGFILYFCSDRNGDFQLFRATRGSLNEPFGNVDHLSFFDTPGGSSARPCLNSDGSALYFVRQLGKDRSSRDIWVSYISEADTYYVDAVNGNDLNNGLSPETAFATVQKGIDSAEGGFNVLVYPGLYTEQINFSGKAITVRGIATSAGIPILENPGDFAVSFYHNEGTDSILKNFVIRNSFIAIFIAGGSPTISNVTVVDNKSGIEAYAGSQPDINSSIFWNNTDGDLFGCQARYSWIQREIQAGLIESLISHWKFDEGQGSIAYDSVGDHHGTIYGAQWTTGEFGGALSFDGINDYVDVPEPIRIDLGTSYTVSVWIKTNIISSNYGIIAAYRHQINPSVLFQLDHYGADARFVVRDESANIATATYSNAITTDTWCHVVGVRKEDILNVYVNGVKGIQSSNTFGQIIPNDLKIGAIDCCLLGMHHYLNGAIDELMIFDRALSAEGIQQLYLLGSEPMFADANTGDYHLKSERGRYWPEHDIWVLDNVTSPCIDGGDPTADPSGEPMPNGGFLNVGAYGGTPYASMSEMPCFDPDVNQDGIVDSLDLAELTDEWLDAAGWIE